MFNVSVEDQPWLTGFDITAKVGTFSADVEEKVVTVTDGSLSLGFTATVNTAKISALEVLSN